MREINLADIDGENKSFLNARKEREVLFIAKPSCGYPLTKEVRAKQVTLL